MSKPVWIKWFPKDSLDGMLTLGPWEELAYRRIIDLIYATGDNLPDDDKKLAWMTKTGGRWKKIKQTLIDSDKIEVIDGRITNPRCQKTLQECEGFFDQKRGAGHASAQKRKSLKDNKTGSTDDATRVDTHDATREPTNQKPDTRIEEGGGGSAHARDADTHGGTVPQPTEADAKAIVQKFLNLRDELWPNNPNFPAPTLTLEGQALGFLQLGGPVELITATLERGMRTAASQGKTATVSLKAFHMSINDAIAGHRAGIKIPEQSHVAGHSRRQQKPSFDEQQQRNREGIYAAFADELDPSGTGP